MSGEQSGPTIVELDGARQEIRDQVLELLGQVENIVRAFPHAETAENDIEMLREARRQVETLFLLVVVGEFNSGKSAFVNALVGEPIMPEGVTPTTSRIHMLSYGSEGPDETTPEGIVIRTHPAPFLREINIVDTPGTNAIIREHEALSQGFVPRADLVLFVTSADRPFSESEREFLEEIQRWGKKIVFVLNKIDLLETEEELDDVISFISDNAARLLNIDPLIFAISSRLAERGDPAGNFEPLRNYIFSTLDETERFRLKLMNPIGVAERLLERYGDIAEDRLATLATDQATIDRIEAHIDAHQEDTAREFAGYRTRVENIVHRLNERADRFFDEYIRIGRVFDLVRSEQTRSAFERDVVAGTEQQIDQTVEEMIDWMVGQDLRLWQTINEMLDRKTLERYREDLVGDIGARFQADRQTLINQVSRQADEVVERYDQRAEATQLAENVRSAIAQTAIAQAGAVSLGAAVVVLATTAAADVTGILAAATVAGLGLLILPARRRSARRELRRRSAELEQQLSEVLEDGFMAELGRSVRRVRDAISPYTRFVASERERLEQNRSSIQGAVEATRLLRRTVNRS
ncbi:dynamin family protein [soil metagenome]